MDEQLDISVVICTRNRAASLAETMERLAEADRTGLRVEIIIVDNASTDNTRSVVESFSDRIRTRYLFEPTLGNYGKSHALNRAVSAGALGDVVAILDDDMTPHADWFHGVAESAR